MLRAGLLACAILAQPLHSQTVTLRAGEHPGFTRLVLTMSEVAGWEFGRSESGYALRSKGNAPKYLLEGAFSRISRDRLADLRRTPDASKLMLDLACDCHAIATPFRPGVIVIDITDGPAPPGSPYESLLDHSSEVAFERIRPRQRPADWATDELAERFLPPIAGNSRGDDAQAERTSALQEALLADLSAGIAAGVLAPKTRKIQTASRPVILAAPATSAEIPPSNSPDDGQFRLRTASGAEPELEQPPPRLCAAPDLFTFIVTEDTTPFAAAITSARRDSYTPDSAPSPEGMLALATLHLRHGFGLEAREILRTHLPDHAELLALSWLVEGEPVPPPHRRFIGMEACPSATSLWSLAEGQGPAPAHTARDAVVAAFSELPPTLRRNTALALANRFIAARDDATVERLHAALERAPTPDDGAGIFLKSHLLNVDQFANGADDSLLQLSQTNSPHAGQALAALVERQISRHEMPDTSTIAELEAHLRAIGRGSGALPVQRAIAKAQLLHGDLTSAFTATLRNDQEFLPELWRFATERSPDAAFAELALAPPEASLRDVTAADRIAIADRLLKTGFPEAAQRWLEGRPEPQAHLIAARAALSLRNGRDSLRRLAGLNGPEANLLRASALELLGNFSEARQVWRETDEPLLASRAAFLGRDWHSMTHPQSASLDGLKQSLLSQQTANPATPLADARAALLAARTLRQNASDSLAQNALSRD